MKDETRTASLLEQLKNLLPMAKKASIELAEYQRKHGTSYESGVPDPNNAMLAASEEIQRQIAHAVRPHSHPEGVNRRSERRRKSQSPVVERTSHRESWSSPFGPNGQVADSVEYIPRRNRVSFKTSSEHAADRHSGDHSIGVRHDGDIGPAAKIHESQPPPNEPPTPLSNGTSYVSKRDLGGTSFDETVSLQKEVNTPNVYRGYVFLKSSHLIYAMAMSLGNQLGRGYKKDFISIR
ncbi:hypothetical protein GGR55DRAFT_565274 [Xylaria sp. FL0064]|nr:hypothetical protein GGR55DRAFT_565274 [Xylaria sp. FL0064]